MQHNDCKDIDITNPETVYPWVKECVKRHILRYDFRALLKHHGMPLGVYRELVNPKINGTVDKNAPKDFTLIEQYIYNIAVDATQRIKLRLLALPPVRIRLRHDRTTDKARLIGDASAMQQVFDFIAVYSSMCIFKRRITPQQVSSIKGRGQIKGVKTIQRWIEQDNRAIRYAAKHGWRYYSVCKYFSKLDVKKCYPSGRLEVFLELFKKDCANADIIWLWEELLRSHRVHVTNADGSKGELYMGFMIGALPSQWAMQYLLSFTFRLIKDGHDKRGKKCASHCLLFLDDILVMSGNRKSLKSIIEDAIAYTSQFLQLTIKPTWNITRLDFCGVDMMGYVIHRSGKITIRGRNFIKSRRLAIRYTLQGEQLSIEQAKRLASKKGEFKYSNSAAVVQEYGLQKIFRAAQAQISKWDKERLNND